VRSGRLWWSSALVGGRSGCADVADKSTLSRLEHAPEEGEALARARFHKTSHDAEAIGELFVPLFPRGASQFCCKYRSISRRSAFA